MDISWLGHACVRVRTRRAAVVMDPADRSAGFTMGRPSAGIVTVGRRGHPHHSHSAGVRGGPVVLDGPGEYEIAGVQVFGVPGRLPAAEGEPPEASRNTAFPRLGLTDAALLEAVSEERPLITADLDLFLAASSKGRNAALNFTHLQAFG